MRRITRGLISLRVPAALAVILLAMFASPNSSCAVPPAPDLLLFDSVSIDGITWKCSQSVPVGRFVNGDYYVVGSVTIVGVTPLSTPANGHNGSVLNMPGDDDSVPGPCEGAGDGQAF